MAKGKGKRVLSLSDAIEWLDKHAESVEVSREHKTIKLNGPVGLKTLSYMDFLVNHHGWHQVAEISNDPITYSMNRAAAMA